MNKFTRALVATLASGSLMIAGAGLAPAASAQSLPAQPQQTIPYNVESGSLTIHKFANDTPGAAGDGTLLEDTSSLGDALQGATFTVQKVLDVDLSTNEGWVEAQRIAEQHKANPEGPKPSLGTAVTEKTDGAGIATFENLEIGLYYVVETEAPTGYSRTAAPFYVTVPMTNPQDRSSWMYDIHVYPKNETVTDLITKTVSDEETIVAGNEIDFTVTGKLKDVDKLGAVEVTDIYPADRLEFREVTKVTLGDGTEIPAEQYTVDSSQPGLAKVSFNATALATMDGLTGEDRKVEVEFKFAVQEAGEGELSALTNRAMIFDKREGDDSTTPPNPNDPNDPRVIPPNDPDNETKTYFGNVRVEKVSTSDAPLPNVEFDLYRCDDDKIIDPANLVKNALTTNAEGVLLINSLHVNDFVNGAPGETNLSGYCLVEVKAADGHSLLAEPAYFQVLKGADETVALHDLKLTNVEDNAGFQLPFTGGEGVTLLLVLGGLIIAIGGGYAYVVNRRKVQG